MTGCVAPHPYSSLVLSLLKDRFSFVPLRERPEEQGRCFVKLSTNGFGARYPA